MRWRFLSFVVMIAACGDAGGIGAPTSTSARPVLRDVRATDEPQRQVVDFEAFALGAIDGQFDWQSFGGEGAAPGRSCAVYDHVIAEPNGSSHREAAFGRRSLRISNAVTSGCYGDQTMSSRSADVAGQAGAVSLSRDGQVNFALPGSVLRNHFDAEWVVASAVPSAQQSGLEVVVSPARGDDHRMSWLRIGDQPDGLALTFAERSDAAQPGAFEMTTIARGLDRRLPHRIRLSMNFVDGPSNDVVRVYVDGELRHVGTSWETYYAADPNGRANFNGNPPAVNRLMFRTGSDSHRGVPGDPAPLTRGHGFYFDQVRVASYAVPVRVADCRDDGWQSLRGDDGRTFKNQGDCVSQLARSRVR
ncbi:MAG: hypothetical protein HYV19_02620 [Gemmatimonadetes bacterium]|nr:hypothetical protein [Gemmatimonadota bacterium]